MESDLDNPSPGLLGSMKNFYYSLEDKYYALMDNLQEKGIPSYSAFVNPIENLKIPSFPVFLVLILAILGSAIFAVSTLAIPTQTVTLTVNLESNGLPVNGLNVILMDSDKELQTLQSDENGNIIFEDVPVKDTIKLKVDEATYNPILEDVTLSTEETNSLTLSLEPRGEFQATTQDFIVKVTDDTGSAITSATVTYQLLGTQETNTLQTTSDGTAIIKLADMNTLLKLSITADGYFEDNRALKATEGTAEFKLQRKAQTPIDEGGTQTEKTTVSIRVIDEQGNAIPSTIELIQKDTTGTIDQTNTESGTAIFDVPAGAIVYAVAKADEFTDAQSDAITAELNQLNEITLTLVKTVSEQSQTAQITITDSDAIPIENAQISLYTATANAYITTTTTDSDGLAEIELTNAPAHYITITTDEHLPLVTEITPGSHTYTLQTATTANSANFDVEVLNYKGETQSSVQIDALDATGRFLGLTTQITGQAGIATFTNAPIDVQLRARASQDSTVKDSDVFILTAGEEDRKIQITLPPAIGKITITTKNILDDTPLSNILIEALENDQNGKKISKCNTNENGKCTLETYSNTPTVLTASALGFEAYTSSTLIISTNENSNQTINLMPSEFKDKTYIKLTSITDENGKDVTTQTQLSKAKTYTTKFAANFPTSKTQGIYLQIGNENTPETAIITNIETTQNNLANPLITTSPTYSPDCNAQLTEEETQLNEKRQDKWTQVEYSGATGTIELTAKIQTLPTAKPGEKLNINYRAYARSATGKTARMPIDLELQNQQNSTKGECQAKTLNKQYEITDGTYTCNDEGTACIEVTFQNLNDGTTAQTPYTSQLNNPFALNYKIKNFAQLEPTSAYVKITTKGQTLEITDYAGDGQATFNTLAKLKTISLADTNINTQTDPRANALKIILGEQKEQYTGSAKINPLTPADFAPITIELGDARGAIATYTNAYTIIQGTGIMKILAIVPTELEVGKAKDVKLKLVANEGVPITDATISIEEENGSPFNGDTPSSIAGDNSNELGENGVYIFKRLKTQAPGTFRVIATKPRYRPTETIITSTIGEFFEYSQPDLIQLTCSANKTSENMLKVKNTLDETINAQITIDPTCATLTAPGVTPVQTALKQGEKPQDAITKYNVQNWKSQKTLFLQLAPNRKGGNACTLEITARDPRTNVQNKDAPVQIENPCSKTTTDTAELKDAEAVIYIHSNSFTPARVIIDVFSYLRYGSYQPQNLWDPRYPDATSYMQTPLGGQYAGANRVAQYAGMPLPYPQYGLMGNGMQPGLDPRMLAPNSYYQPKGNTPIRIGSENIDTTDGKFFGTAAFQDPNAQNTFINVARQNDKRNYTIAFVNEDETPHALKCKNRNGDTILNIETIEPAATHVATISKPGLYQCKLETGDKGTIKIKSMCPQKGALYYTRLITRCMARNALGQTGLFDGGKQHAASIAASVKTRFVVYANRVTPGQTDKDGGPECKYGAGEVTCQIKVSPLIQQNGFAFSIEDATGQPNYRATYVESESNVPLKQCAEIVSLDTESSYRAILAPIISAVSTTGLTTPSKYTSWAIKFNPTGNCIKVRPVGTTTTMKATVYNPATDKFVGNGKLTFDLISQNNPNIKLRVKLEITPQDANLDSRFLFTTIPTTGSLYYRSQTAPKEPGFIINNLPGENIALGVTAEEKTQDIVHANSLAVLTGNNPSTPGHYNTISDFARGYYLCTEHGGCNVADGQATQIKNFKLNPTDEDAQKENKDVAQIASQLGDVIGNYKLDKTAKEKEKTDAFKCSGTQYCSSESERKAAADANEQFAKAIREQYKYVETINIDSAIENTGDALSGCIQEAMAEIVAQEAQYQLCKTLANMCTGQGMFDPEEEEIEDGENFAGGLTLDAVLGDSQTIVKDIICQETEFGQNLQKLRECLGNRQCKDLIASRIAGNLKQAKIQSVVSAVPVVDIKQPTVFYVTKRIQDVPSPDNTNLASEKHGGYNIYQFKYDEQALLKKQETDTLFTVSPPGYDLSKYIAATASAPSQLTKSIIQWIGDDSVPVSQAQADQLAQETKGFPYVTPDNTVQFDKFKPNLLTINKYPIIRAYSQVAKETKTEYNKEQIAQNQCTLTNRPVDPLGLFDSCEDLRGAEEQRNYDAADTETKAPLSKSLVFLAVPNTVGDFNGKPTWPLDWNEFKVTLTPQNELYSTGKTTTGVSAPYIAKLPIFGTKLYPYAPSEQDLAIPKDQAANYAIIVKNCKYTRSPNGEITLDASKPQCDQTTAIEHLAPSDQVAKCQNGKACAFITINADKNGKYLNIVALDGIDKNKKASSNIKISDKEPTTIDELTRELLRYYTDESYKAEKLTTALTSKACQLEGNENNAFLQCGEIQDTSSNTLTLTLPTQTLAKLDDKQETGFQLKLSSDNELTLTDTSLTSEATQSGASNDPAQPFGSLIATFTTDLGKPLEPKLIADQGNTQSNPPHAQKDAQLFTQLTKLTVEDNKITNWKSLNGEPVLVMHVIYQKKSSTITNEQIAQIQLYYYNGKELTQIAKLKGDGTASKTFTAKDALNAKINTLTDKKESKETELTQDQLTNGHTTNDAIQRIQFYSQPATTTITINFEGIAPPEKTPPEKEKTADDILITNVKFDGGKLIVEGLRLPPNTKVRIQKKLTNDKGDFTCDQTGKVTCKTSEPFTCDAKGTCTTSLPLTAEDINGDYNFVRIITDDKTTYGLNHFLKRDGHLNINKPTYAPGDDTYYCSFDNKYALTKNSCPNPKTVATGESQTVTFTAPVDVSKLELTSDAKLTVTMKDSNKQFTVKVIGNKQANTYTQTGKGAVTVQLKKEGLTRGSTSNKIRIIIGGQEKLITSNGKLGEKTLPTNAACNVRYSNALHLTCPGTTTIGDTNEPTTEKQVAAIPKDASVGADLTFDPVNVSKLGRNSERNCKF